MKSQVKLQEFLPHLPPELQDGIDKLLKTAETEAELHRRVNIAELTPKGDHTFIGYASTRTLDRDLEVVMPHGMDLSQFRKAPVLLWGHKWSEPPIGKDELIESDGFGLKTKSKMATTPLAEDLWKLVHAEMLKTSSIGFIPLEYKSPGDKDWGKLMDEMDKWPEFDKNAEMRGVVTRSIMLEHSLVSVPANIDALVTAIAAKGLKADTLLKELGKGGMIHDIDIRQYMVKFSHNSELAESEPDWGSVDKTRLPRLAFADQGEEGKKSTWGFPHHWVQGGGELDDMGIYTSGTMYLHRGGLNAAWSAAQGGRSGDEANNRIKAHLNMHREALGMAEPKSYHKLVKTPEQIRIEMELEVQAAVAREIKLRMGRI